MGGGRGPIVTLSLLLRFFLGCKQQFPSVGCSPSQKQAKPPGRKQFSRSDKTTKATRWLGRQIDVSYLHYKVELLLKLADIHIYILGVFNVQYSGLFVCKKTLNLKFYSFLFQYARYVEKNY